MKSRFILAKAWTPALIFSGLLLTRIALAGNTWDGGGANGLWSTNANWSGDTQPAYGTLTFSGALQTTMTDDNITSMNQLNWTGSSSAWTLNQGGTTVLSLFDNGGTQAKIENNSTGLVTINLPIKFSNTNATNPFGEINAVSAGLTFGAGALTVDGSQVNGIKLFGSGQTVTFNNTVNASNATNGGKGNKYFGFTTGGTGNTVNIGGTFNSGDWYVMNSGTLNLASGGTLNTTAVRLGGDFGNTGNQDQTKGGKFQLAGTAGGQNFGGTINSVSGNTSAALAVNSLNTSNTNTLSGGIFLDSNLSMTQSSGGTLSLTGGSIDLKAQTLTLLGNGGTINVGDIVSNSTGSGQLVVGTNGTAGSGGTVTLSAANTYSGETFVRSGTLAFTSTGSVANSTIRLGSTSGASVTANISFTTAAGGVNIGSTINPVTTSGSGTLTLDSQNTSGSNTYSGHIGLDRNLSITQSSGGTLLVTQARAGGVGTTTGTDIKGFTLTLSPAASGIINVTGDIYNSVNNGTVAVTGGGTVALSGANTYSGGTTINGSTTLGIGANGALGSGQLTFSGSGNVQASGGARTIANNVSLSGGSATFTGTNDLTINGTVTGANGSNRAFNNTAAGVTLTLAGNIYITSNQASSQTLTLGNTATSGSAGTNTLVTGAIANNSGTNTVASNVDIGGGATVIFAGTNTYTGNTTISNTGTVLKVGNGGTTGNLGAGNVTVTTGNLSFNRSNAMTVANNISGTGTVSQIGGGTTTLSGNNAFSGATTISNGTLEAASANALGGTSNVTINTGGTLLLTNTGTADRINDSATITMAGGKIAFSGNVTEGSSPDTGPLTLTANSIIDFAGGNAIINFGNSSGATWTGSTTLSIYNWDGLPAGNGNDQIIFGIDNNALTASQLAQVNFYSGNGSGFLGTATILSDGELVPIPEPGAVFTTLGLLGLVGYRERRRRRG